MDGKGRAIDNRWVETSWRTIKHKFIYLNPPANGIDLNEGDRDYIKYYNEEKAHHTFKEVPKEGYLRSKNENNQYQLQALTKTERSVV